MRLTEKRKRPVKAEEKSEPAFSREQIAASARYDGHRDVVNALLDDGKQYTMTQVDDLISSYMKGKVK